MGYFDELEKQRQEGKSLGRQACKILADAGIDIVAFRYDGSGDSGQIEQEVIYRSKTKLSTDDVDRVVDSLYDYGDIVSVSNDSDEFEVIDKDTISGLTKVTKKNAHQFDGGRFERVDVELHPVDALEDMAYDVMPSGWEINEGAFGAVFIFTKLGVIEFRQETRLQETSHEAGSESF